MHRLQRGGQTVDELEVGAEVDAHVAFHQVRTIREPGGGFEQRAKRAQPMPEHRHGRAPYVFVGELEQCAGMRQCGSLHVDSLPPETDARDIPST